ncbi:Penicillin-binding protein 2D [Nonomuraea coxensis DSM 45129]|uniref:Penicillin-binding protein 2D n=1 Tax=Nonomuraea coxensis DSM 45129 TaxID=1122611 RepID=A0ABX8UDX5_9ACTN|nr:transglycosylase domain-containing protein [Nonomuraea coxensis]QYC46011.1 Penicillin-binding protein 2D [Nonomuraea coxensis DSM 45129]
MAAQQYDAQPYDPQPPRREPMPPQREPMPPRREDVPPGAPGRGDQPSARPGRRSRQERPDTRAASNQETVIAEGPRRSRRRAQGGPPEPPGPPGPPSEKDGGGRGGWRRFLPSWKLLVAGFVVIAAGLFGMVMVAYANTQVPTGTQADAIAQQSTIYYADGKTEIASLGKKREIVKLAQMAPAVRDAAIAIENPSFYEDSGISISGMFRSIYMTATGQQLQGASTITQQMARNYYDGLSQEVSIKRKVNEIFVAVKLDETLSKDEILERYLNTVNFGRAYGVEAAAKAYFGAKATAAKLTPAQSAYLAARIQQPAWSSDDPALKSRFDTVVKYMATQWPDKYGTLPQTAKFPKTVKEGSTNEMGGLKGYMVKVVLDELRSRGLSEDEVRSGGFRIVSTFDRKLMLAAKEAVTSTMSSMNKEYHAGLAAVDPRNGRVIAFYGGTNYITDPWNEPFQSKKQAASAFKPYVLAAWLQAGYSLKSYVPGNETVPKVLPGQQPGGIKNSHNVGVAVDVVKATAQSVNTAFVSMAYKLPGQLDEVRSLVEAAGFDPKDMKADIEEHHYQFAIGSAPVTPVEQAAGYSIFANGGKYTRWHVVKEVKQGNKVVYGEQRVSKNVIDAGVAADSTVAMQEVLRSGTAAGKGLGNRPAAGKTGTNNDENGAWFVGYTPQISTAVGFYREQCVTKSGKVVPPLHSNCPITPKGKASKKYGPDNPYTRPREVSLGFEGAGPPTIAWQKFMLAAHEGKPIEQFPQKSDVGLPENIVPSPTPTPTPTADDDPFGGDDPFGDEDPGNGRQDCLVPPCNDQGPGNDDNFGINDDGGADPNLGDNDGFGGPGGFGGALAPAPRPSGREGW